MDVTQTVEFVIGLSDVVLRQYARADGLKRPATKKEMRVAAAHYFNPSAVPVFSLTDAQLNSMRRRRGDSLDQLRKQAAPMYSRRPSHSSHSSPPGHSSPGAWYADAPAEYIRLAGDIAPFQEGYIDGLGTTDKKAIEDYADGGESCNYNHVIRRSPARMQKWPKPYRKCFQDAAVALGKVILDAPKEHPGFIVFSAQRGVTAKHSERATYLDLKYSRFISTSTSYELAYGMLDDDDKQDRRSMLVIRIPENYPCLDLRKHSAFSEQEQEILLPPGTTLVMDRMANVRNVDTWYCQVEYTRLLF